MQRRKFLKNSTATGISLAAIASLTACNTTTMAPAIADGTGTDADFELMEITVPELQQRMEAGKLTSAAITQLYLDRIAAIDQKGPALHAVIELNPDALAIAEAMDKERSEGKIRGSLHGIPVLIKDNINSGDKMQTTAGALALEGNKALKDAFIIDKLRENGAVLLGKTNLSEWANFRSTKSCSGWSSRGGQSKNPYILSHNPCGSSAGSGAAVAANLCALAIGTETDGSITCPASVNGIVGIKPTVGLWSRSGIIPISATQDTAGPMARTVKDAAILLGALVGEDPEDRVTLESSGKGLKDYAVNLDGKGLQGKRIGIDLQKKSIYAPMNALLEQAIELMKQQGAEIVDVQYIDLVEALGDWELKILQYEFKDGVNKYLAESNIAVKSLADVIAFNKANEDKAMPYFKQEQLEACEAKGTLAEAEYEEALIKGRDASRKILNDLMAANTLDAFAGLTMGPACSIDVLYGDRYSSDFLTQPAAMAGYPHISLPCGLIYDLPVGLSFFGAPYSEAGLIAMAYSYEQAGTARPLPRYKSGFFG